MKQTARLTLN